MAKAQKPPRAEKQSTKNRLMLSVHDTVKERAKAYAESQGTSVSAMVESFLGQVAQGGEPMVGQPAGQEEVTAIIQGIAAGKIRILAAGLVGLEGNNAVIYLDDGRLLVDRAAPMSLDVIRARAALLNMGLPVTLELRLPDVDIALIRTPPSDVEPSVAEAEKARAEHRAKCDWFLCLTEAYRQSATTIVLKIKGDQATKEIRMCSGNLSEQTGSAEHVRLMMDVAVRASTSVGERFSGNIAVTKYRGNYMRGHIDRQKFPVPGPLDSLNRLQSLGLLHIPGANADHVLIVTLNYESNSYAAIDDSSFREDHLSKLQQTRAIRGGLFVVASLGTAGARVATMRRLISENPFTADNRGHGLMLDPGAVADIPGFITGSTATQPFYGPTEGALAGPWDVIGVAVQPNIDMWHAIGRALASGIQVWVCLEAASAAAAVQVALSELCRDERTFSRADHGVTGIWQEAVLNHEAPSTRRSYTVLADCLHVPAEKIRQARVPKHLDLSFLMHCPNTLGDRAWDLVHAGKLDLKEVAALFPRT